MTKQAEAEKKETTTKAAATEKVVLRNPDIRGVSLIQADNTSLFIKPKGKVTIEKSQLSKTIRDQIKSGLVTQEE